MNIGIIGATGYGGAELIRILQYHPKVTFIQVYSSTREGSSIIDSYPHLNKIMPLSLKSIDPLQMAKEHDVVFLATPSGVSSKLAPDILEAGCNVIDLSGDFRLKDPLSYEKWYGKKPGPTTWINEAVYGLPEVNRNKVKSASFIANPGCYPTATLLGLQPLLKKGIIEKHSLIIDAKSGVSGAGRSASVGSIYSEVNENLKIYKPINHQHIPEIEQLLKDWGYDAPITFHPHLIPMTRGIMVTMYGQVKNKISDDTLHKLYDQYYSDEPFVRIRPKGTFPTTKEVSGSNFCDIGLTYDQRTGRITVVSVIDNMMKGAAGQAVQNANIMFDLEETTGLNYLPVYP